MNILPKKRWHVRTKDNIARVRRDEAKALADEKERIRRIQLAEQEARTKMLRERAKDRFALSEPVEDEAECQVVQTIQEESGHINFFKALEEGEKVSKGNKEYEEEKKKEKETYEKNIGLLTYLGQSALEAQTSPWYEKLPSSTDEGKDIENSLSRKLSQDPLMDIKKYLGCSGIQKLKQKPKPSQPASSSGPDGSVSRKRHKSVKEKKKKSKKSKKRKTHSSESESECEEHSKPSQTKSIEQLRRERIEREKAEKLRAQKLLAKVYKTDTGVEETKESGSVKQRYNSQFNPHLAKQNFDPGTKYWLS